MRCSASGSSRSITNVGWKLPSPACPNTPDTDAVPARDALDGREQLRDAWLRWTPDVLHARDARLLQGPVRLAPGLPEPVGLLRVGRPDDLGRARRGAGAPARSSSASAAAPPASDSIMSIAPASSGRPTWSAASTARMVNRSSSSRVTGTTPSRVDARDRLARRRARTRKKASIVSLGGGHRQQPQGGLGDDAEGPLGADEQLRQVVAHDVLDRAAAGPDDGAVREHHLQAQHVVARHAVLDAAQAARVLGQVAADGADLEAGRVGWVEQAVLRDRAAPGRR